MTDLGPIRGLLLGAALGVPATFGVRALAHRIGFVSAPNPIVAQHTRTVAYGGGIAVALAAAFAFVLLGGGVGANPTPLAIAAVLFLVLGVTDDARAFRTAPKFALQVVVASVAVWKGMVYAWTGMPVVDIALSVVWILALVNAFNVVDVCDGLLAGLATVFFAYGAIAFPAHAMLSACVAGACLGFLVFNRPKATIFLGDAGSHFLGFVAAGISLTPGSTSPSLAYIPALGLAAGVPLFESVFLVYARATRGLPWWKGSPDHFALRLQGAGFTAWRTILTAWTAAAALAAIAFVLRVLPTGAALAICAVSLLAAIAVARWLLIHTEPRVIARTASRPPA